MSMSHVSATVPLVDQPFALDHAAQLAAFQVQGEERFLWGLDSRTGAMFFLEENAGHDQHDHVVANVVCPVPGCGAALTTVHSTVKRDHLRHLVKDTGGHGLESFFHAQGCALVHSWLTERYPGCTVIREEYTNAEGERRADVLITAPSLEKMAFEVQYSPLTHDAWTERHESYQAQGIQDVWLFGHTEKQLKLDIADTLRSKPALDAVAATGVPVLFINPTTEQLAIAVEWANRYSWSHGWISPADVPIIGKASGARIEVFSLEQFTLTRSFLTSPRIVELTDNAAGLTAHNDEQMAIERRMREQAAADQVRRDANMAAASERKKKEREALAAEIRTALDAPVAWAPGHPAVGLIRTYLDGYWRRDLGVVHTPGGAGVIFERWKCVAYFHRVAGQTANFDTRDVAETLREHRVRLEKGVYRTIGRWLHQLDDDGFLFEDSSGTYSSYEPTFRGTWW
jgi:hypothetical protein